MDDLDKLTLNELDKELILYNEILKIVKLLGIKIKKIKINNLFSEEKIEDKIIKGIEGLNKEISNRERICIDCGFRGESKDYANHFVSNKHKESRFKYYLF